MAEKKNLQYSVDVLTDKKNRLIDSGFSVNIHVNIPSTTSTNGSIDIGFVHTKWLLIVV